MKFSVDPWAPDYGGAVGGDALTPSDVPTNIDIEMPIAAWAPVDPGDPAGTGDVLFVDGVQRVEARVWVTEADGSVRPGICASYAAGVVRCNGRAEVVATAVERRMLCGATAATDIDTRHARFEHTPVSDDSADGLAVALHQRRATLEVVAAREAAAGDDLVVVDGRLQQGHAAATVGSIKSHERAYGPPIVLATVAELKPGQRTPVFVLGERFSRFSWYVRLPAPASHPLSGVVRCEASTDLALPDVVRLADRLAALLPRFASEPHKDPRAPQNLYPIGGLERELRRRLGDQQLLYRALRVAAVSA